MRIIVDDTRCTGHGFCENIAEDIFDVQADGMTHLRQDIVGEDRRADIDEAIAACPTLALSATEDQAV